MKDLESIIKENYKLISEINFRCSAGLISDKQQKYLLQGIKQIYQAKIKNLILTYNP